MCVYVFVLFFILTPGILVSLPPKGSKMVVAATHALVFSLLFCVTCKMVLKFTRGALEGMTPTPATPKATMSNSMNAMTPAPYPTYMSNAVSNTSNAMTV